MPLTKRAVVCSGGGAKGGYQVGAWQALRELGYEPDIVTGTSVGALNGALMVSGLFEQALEIWDDMGMERVFAPFTQAEDAQAAGDVPAFSLRFLQRAMFQGGADSTPFQALVRAMADEEVMRASPIRYGLVTTRYPKIKGVELFIEDIPQGLLADYIIASASAFPVMRAHKIGDTAYIDGGYTDNMPVKMALRAGATQVVALNIGAMPGSAPHGDNVSLHYVSAKRPLTDKFGGIFMFDSDLAKRNLRQGYLDTYKCFDLLDGHYYSFERYETYKTEPFERECRKKFEQSFCTLPDVGMLEKRARGRVVDFLQSFGDKPFDYNSNTLHCAEAAAELFEVSSLEIYTLDGFTKEILQKLHEFSSTESYLESERTLIHQLDEGFSLRLLRPLAEHLDKKLLTALCLRYLRRAEPTLAEKRRIWGIAAIFPEVYCAGLFLAAATKAE